MKVLPCTPRLALLGIAIAVAAVAVGYVQATKTLRVNGALASSRVIEVKGVAYVPIQDVAKAFQMTMMKTSAGYALGPAGGAGMVVGLQGKVGEELFNGFARFKVIETLRTKAYRNRFSGDRQEVLPRGEHNELIIIVCRIKNGLKVSLEIGLPGGELSGLTDMNERSFAFLNTVNSDVPLRLVKLLPGSATDFALTFEVPEGTEIKDLVYEAQDLGGKNKAEPFRVTLR